MTIHTLYTLLQHFPESSLGGEHKKKFTENDALLCLLCETGVSDDQ